MRDRFLATVLFLSSTAAAWADTDQVPTAVKPLPPGATTHYDIPSEPRAIYLAVIAAVVFGVCMYIYKTSGKNRK